MTRLTLQRLGLLVAGTMTAAGCGTEIPALEEGVRTDALFGTARFEYCDGEQERVIRQAWALGKVAAFSSTFSTCVRGRPYLSCSDDESTDPWVALRASRSPNDLSIQCRVPDEDQQDWAGWTSQDDAPLHSEDEAMKISKSYLDTFKWGQTAPLKWGPGLAGVLWHEVMHTHGWMHGSGNPCSSRDSSEVCEQKRAHDYADQCDRDPNSWHYRTNSMPYIVGQCMSEAVRSMIPDLFRAYLSRDATDQEVEFYINEIVAGAITTNSQLTSRVHEAARIERERVRESLAFSVSFARDGKCMDIENASVANGARLQMFPCSGSPNQRFRLRRDLLGNMSVIATHSGRCLDVPGHDPAAGRIQQFGCQSRTNQQWVLRTASYTSTHAWYTLQSVTTGKFLGIDSNGKVVQTDSPGAVYFEALTYPRYGPKKIQSVTEPVCFDVPSSTLSRYDVQVFPCHGNTNQTWYFVPTSDDRFLVRATHSRLCLDSIGSAGVEQDSCAVGPGTEWRLHLNADASVELRSASNECLRSPANRLQDPFIKRGACAQSIDHRWRLHDAP